MCCRLFHQFIDLTVLGSLLQKSFNEVSREKGEGKRRAKSQFIRTKIIFFIKVAGGEESPAPSHLVGSSLSVLLGCSCFELVIDCVERMT